MTLTVRYGDLEVKSERTEIDRAFFNRRYRAVYDELSRIDALVDHFGATEQTLVQLGLDRINQTLGPALSTLQSAAELGFLVCYSDGNSHSLVLGEYVGWNITDGAELFTPTPFLLAMDTTDPDNWGILQLDPDGWHASTGELATHVMYANKTQTSTSWSISASSAMLPAMQAILDDANAAKAACQAADASVAAQMANLADLAAAIEAGPVASVAGRTGVITLVESDIAGLVSDLAAKTTTTYVNTQVSTKQTSSAKLDALINLTWAANKLIYATGFGTLGTTDVTDFIKTVLAAADAAAARMALGISPTDVSTLAPLASPVFTGDPRAPSPAIGDSDTSIATTEFVKAQAYAPLASPALTGTPTAPTAAAGTNTTQVATTAFAVAAASQGLIASVAVGASGTYNVTAADLGRLIMFNISGSGGNLYLNLPAGMVTGFWLRFAITVLGSNFVTTSGSGAVVNNSSSVLSSTTYVMHHVVHIGSNNWLVLT